MNSIALTKTDRAKKIGGFLWLVIAKLAHGIAFVLKKINWKRVGFVSWHLVVLAFGILLAFGKLIASLFVGLIALFRDNLENDENSQETEGRYLTLLRENMSSFAKYDQDE